MGPVQNAGAAGAFVAATSAMLPRHSGTGIEMMKNFAAILILAFSAVAMAAEKPASPQFATRVITGEVLETIDASEYTYLRLKTREGEVWAAVARAELKKGATVTVENAMAMKDFKSKTLNRTFTVLMMGELGGADRAAPHASRAKPTVDTANLKVAKAAGANAKTVAEILTKSAELKDKPVLVRGKVVRYNEGIMGKNWLHLRDGTGAEADGSNDLLVTTNSQAKLGDIVTAKGIVQTDRNYGAGYSYKVLVGDATLQP